MKIPSFSAYLFIVLVCLAASFATAFASGDEWRAIDPAELALKAPVVEKDADAEALFWEVRVDDSELENLVFNNYIRIKIFTERGRESQSKIDIVPLRARGVPPPFAA